MGALHVDEFVTVDGYVGEPTRTFDNAFVGKMRQTLGAVTGRWNCKLALVIATDRSLGESDW